MRVSLIFIWILLFSLELYAQSNELQDTMKNYRLLLKDLDSSLKPKKVDCTPVKELNSEQKFCSVREFCTMSEIHAEDPIFYQNGEGGRILNEGHYQERESLRTCLKEKYADELKTKRAELIEKMGHDHLKKIIAANKKLNQLVDKHKQSTKVQKISSEILNMTLEAGIKNEWAAWDKENVSQVDLSAFLKLAEKRSKITLHPDIKKSLIEIQFLKRNPRYVEQVDKMEREMFPETKPDDPLYSWDLLTDEKASGGRKNLELNRAKMASKAQEAYALFLDTQKELLSYLESKKTENNIDHMERIIKKVKTISFNPPRLTEMVKSMCQTPNAFYNPADHSFTICPQMLDFPKMSLIETIAHEISHSFDSCNFSTKLYKKSGPQVMEEAPFEIDLQMEYVSNHVSTVKEDPAYAKAKNKIHDTALYRDHPFSKTLSCLQSDESVGARSMNRGELKNKVKAKLSELDRLGQNTTHNLEARYVNYLKDNQEEFFDHFQGCDIGNAGTRVGRSQMQEAFSDKIASEVVARKLKTQSPDEAKKSFLEIMLSYGDLCSKENDSSGKVKEFANRENCPNFFDNIAAEDKVIKGIDLIDPAFNTHPDVIKRIERNHLAHPEIRNALNCPLDSGVKYCE